MKKIEIKICIVIIITMNKYHVETTSPDGVITIRKFRTRKQIVDEYEIQLYLVDKIIKLCNDKNYQSKGTHRIFKDLIDNMKILLIKSKFLTSNNPTNTDDQITLVEPIKSTKIKAMKTK
jgi:hypothetical protein